MTLSRAFKDPLWLFLLFGGLLFGIAATREGQRVIRVTEGDVQRSVERWQQQMRGGPAPAERARHGKRCSSGEADEEGAAAQRPTSSPPRGGVVCGGGWSRSRTANGLAIAR